MNNERIKNIEFLRIIGCVAIILYHLCGTDHRIHGLFPDISLYNNLYNMMHNGNKAVDLFFILSGIFFIIKLDTTKSLWEFIKKKLIRLYPVLLFLALAYFVVSLFLPIQFHLHNNILALLCLNGTGLTLTGPNLTITWYVSVMLWTLGIYYYLLKHFKKETVNIIILCIILFCYSFIIHSQGGNINGVLDTKNYIFSIGMMRGLAGIGLGYFIGEWYKNNVEKIKNLSLSIYNKLFITAAEFVCLYFIINNLMLHRLKFNNQIIFIIAFAIITTLFLLRKGFISNLLENTVWNKFSKYTYSLYMTHSLLMNIFKASIWQKHPELVYSHPILNIVITLICVLIFGVLTYHLVEKPCYNYLKNRIQNKD